MVGTRPWLLLAVLLVAGDCSVEEHEGRQQHEPRQHHERRRLAAADHKIWRGRLPHGMRRKYILVHIPKGSGVSFLKDSPNHMAVGSTCTGSHEKAILSAAPQSYLRANKGAQPVVLLRHPIKLAYSQFIMAKCYYFKKQAHSDYFTKPVRSDDYFKKQATRRLSSNQPDYFKQQVRSDQNYVRKQGSDQTPFGDVPCKPAVAGLDQWVSGLTHQLEKNSSDAVIDAHGSYNPIDIQSRYVSTAVSAWGVKRSNVPANLTKAKLRLRSFAFVGIVDLYPESLCLFRFHATKRLPAHCGCNTTAKHTLTNETHDLPPHSLADLDDETQRRVSKLVEADIQLYAHALDVFLVQIKKAEKMGPRKTKKMGPRKNNGTDHNGTDLTCYRDKVAAIRLDLATQFPDLISAAAPATPASFDDADRSLFDFLHPPSPDDAISAAASPAAAAASPASLPPSSLDDAGHILFDSLHPPPPPSPAAAPPASLPPASPDDAGHSFFDSLHPPPPPPPSPASLPPPSKDDAGHSLFQLLRPQPSPGDPPPPQ